MTRRDKLKGRDLLCLITVPISIQVLVLSLPLTCRSSYEMGETKQQLKINIYFEKVFLI